MKSSHEIIFVKKEGTHEPVKQFTLFIFICFLFG